MIEIMGIKGMIIGLPITMIEMTSSTSVLIALYQNFNMRII